MKKPKISTLTKKLDTVFSLYIRQRDSDENGNGKCCTCPHFAHYKTMDNGHGVTRGDRSTRWDERNAMLQCKRCNMRGGEQAIFAKVCDERFGEGTWEELQIQRKQIFKRPASWYEDEIKRFKEKIEEL